MPGCDIGHFDPSTGDAYSTEAPSPTSIFLRGPYCSALNLFVAIRIFETVDNLLLSFLYTCIVQGRKGHGIYMYYVWETSFPVNGRIFLFPLFFLLEHFSCFFLFLTTFQIVCSCIFKLNPVKCVLIRKYSYLNFGICLETLEFEFKRFFFATWH